MPCNCCAYRTMWDRYLPQKRPSKTSTPQRSLFFFLSYWSYLFYLLNAGVDRVTVSPDHAQWHTHALGRTPLDEWPVRRRDLYIITHNIHYRKTAVPSAGFEPAFPASERQQTHALSRAAPGISSCTLCFLFWHLSIYSLYVQRVTVALYLSLSHTHTHSVGLLRMTHRPVAATSTRQPTTLTRDRHPRPAGFEPAIPASERPQTHAATSTTRNSI